MLFLPIFLPSPRVSVWVNARVENERNHKKPNNQEFQHLCAYFTECPCQIHSLRTPNISEPFKHLFRHGARPPVFFGSTALSTAPNRPGTAFPRPSLPSRLHRCSQELRALKATASSPPPATTGRQASVKRRALSCRSNESAKRQWSVWKIHGMKDSLWFQILWFGLF